MTSQTNIIDLNNQTVASLHQQDYPKAIEYSSSALWLQRDIISAETTRYGSSPKEGTSLIDQYMLLSQPDHNKTNHEMMQTAFTYDLGILLPTKTDGNIMDQAVATPILVFNLALAHHQLYGGKSQSSNRRMLIKTRRLYELAHASINAEDNVLFHFAIVNNIAVIDRMIGNTSVSNENLDYLMSLFMILVDRGNENSVLLRQLKGFPANLPTTEVAAPAA